jgi:hypothetical protein
MNTLTYTNFRAALYDLPRDVRIKFALWCIGRANKFAYSDVNPQLAVVHRYLDGKATKEEVASARDVLYRSPVCSSVRAVYSLCCDICEENSQGEPSLDQSCFGAISVSAYGVSLGVAEKKWEKWILKHEFQYPPLSCGRQQEERAGFDAMRKEARKKEHATQTKELIRLLEETKR